MSEKDVIIRNFIAIKKRGSTYYFDHPKLHSCDSRFKDFEFNKSWDWLMPVVKKISRLQESNLDETIAWLANEFGRDGIKDLREMYGVVIAFIRSYNEEKSLANEDERNPKLSLTKTRRNVKNHTYCK